MGEFVRCATRAVDSPSPPPLVVSSILSYAVSECVHPAYRSLCTPVNSLGTQVFQGGEYVLSERDYLASPEVASTYAIPPSWFFLVAPKATTSLTRVRDICYSLQLDPNRSPIFASAVLMVAL